MLGINEIGNKNALMTGTKDTPSFGNAYTPSFGSTTYHDEFVSNHENGVTVKQIGLFALIGLAIGAGVAMLLKKPSTAATEELEHVVEYQLQERGWLKRFFTKTPEEIQKKAEIKAAKAAAEAKAKEAKIDAQIRLAEAENKLKTARSGLGNSSPEAISSNETVLERAKKIKVEAKPEKKGLFTRIKDRFSRGKTPAAHSNELGTGEVKFDNTPLKADTSEPANIVPTLERTPELDKARSEFLGTLEAKKNADTASEAVKAAKKTENIQIETLPDGSEVHRVLNDDGKIKMELVKVNGKITEKIEYQYLDGEIIGKRHEIYD